MPKQLLFLLLLLHSVFAFSQKPYFQQQVDYTIDVTLDDRSHILRGFETMLYTNHSNDTLKVIFIHLWPNAYKDDQSSYNEQEVENGKTKFYFSKENDKGFIDSLNFMVDGVTANFSTYNNHDDIAVIDLSEPLLPGKTIEIATPFRVVIPYTFSRLGHMGQSYQISQWYPKPAVYDKLGWHPMPYLDQGEFYSEYGSYSVGITLPSNYVVVATGDLQEESERQFIASKLNHVDTVTTKEMLPEASSDKMKTISFKQQNVHDFAWFADKQLQVEKTVCSLASGKKVDCYSYFKPFNYKKYKESSAIIASTISYLSQHVGEYPYQHASIVDGSLFAGDGMEYPNVAVIGSVNSTYLLQAVIVHEVGHNWFYGLLGSNERDYPWMDEGMNSFYEKEITDELGHASNNIKMSGNDRINQKLNGSFLYQLTAIGHTDQAANLQAEEYTSLNYGCIVYQKSAAFMAYLKLYLGDELFENAMKQYYNEWHNKHPGPDDFKKIIQRVSGKKLDWFFDQGLSTTTKIDFKITSVQHHKNTAEVKAISKTDFQGPIPVQACINDSVIATQWIEFPYNTAAKFSNLHDAVNSFRIDTKGRVPEVKITNNDYNEHKLFRKKQPKLKFGSSIGVSKESRIYILPSVGYNYYDRFMAGILLHNLSIPNKKLQFALAPMYATGSKSYAGSGFVSYSIFPNKIAQQITLGLYARTYHFDESHLNLSSSIFLQYYKLMPEINIEFKKKTARSPIANQLGLRCALIGKQSFKYTFNTTDSLYRPTTESFVNKVYGELKFTHKNNRTFNPYGYAFTATGNNDFLKTCVEGNLRIDYHMKGKGFYVRAFGGMYFGWGNLNGLLSEQQYYLNSTYNANNDFMYDHVFMARSEQKGFLTHQIAMKEGGFKIQTLMLNNPVGVNDQWLTSVNLRSDLPIKLPFKVQLFIDAGTYAHAGKLNSSGNKLIYDGGVELHLFSDLLVIYAPLMMSKEFKDYTKSTYSKNRLLNSISFSLNTDKISWYKTQRLFKL